MASKYQVDENGYYGQFGGAFIPEMLYPNVEELRQNYLKFMNTDDFKSEFNDLLKSMAVKFTSKEKTSLIQELIKLTIQ